MSGDLSRLDLVELMADGSARRPDTLCGWAKDFLQDNGRNLAIDARCFDPSRIARTSPRTYVEPHLHSAPHPAFGHLPRFAEKGENSRPPVTR